ncbi:RNA-binding domain-containing protein [Agrobacterium tumefaciens]|uniref:RNA-binding domain-containing protein n=1 Tax=Agrobacterium tumefaciens TaxID=358 RepID=UPI001574AD2A|nr:ATP-binding protein [Agrobacterium tumefaciens]
MKYDYNPFNAPFENVTAEDLAVLRNVAEGWYVEYKREPANANAVAKSITALANTYGGWVFYGIDEKSKSEPVAGAFSGIPSEQADATLQRIRQAVANHAQPTPFFQAKSLAGPVDAIGLAPDRCIIVVHVPWGPAAPFVHKDGRIYRRVGDGSEPKEETDRFLLDQLWRRSDKILDEYASWIDEDLETSEGEKNAPFLRLFLVADFWRDHPLLKDVSLRAVRDIFSRQGAFRTPYMNVFKTVDGFIARQVANEDPEAMGLTWKCTNDLQTEVIVPLSMFSGRDLKSLRDHFEGYVNTDRFLEVCRQQRYKTPRILDLNLLFYVLLGQMSLMQELAAEFGWSGPFSAKIKVSGVWRAIPFLDNADYVDEVAKHGLPLLQSDEISICRGKEKTTFIALPPPAETDDQFDYVIVTATRLFYSVISAMGVPSLIEDEADPEGRILSYTDVGERAIKVMRLRTEKQKETARD